MSSQQDTRTIGPRNAKDAVPQSGAASCGESADHETQTLRKSGWDKPTFNFLIEALMFLLLMAMAGLGFLMKYVLIPGQERWVKYGRNLNLTLFGWDRHDWGSIHLYLGLLFLGLLVFHIILHWRQIVGFFHAFVPVERRTLVLLVFLLLAIVLIYFPFLVTPEIGELGRGLGRGLGRVPR